MGGKITTRRWRARVLLVGGEPEYLNILCLHGIALHREGRGCIGWMYELGIERA